MTNFLRAAHIRAARHNPAYRLFQIYTQALDPVRNRPIGGRFTLLGSAYGRLRWTDTDELQRALGGEVGDGVATLLADYPATPAAIRDPAGQWYSVTSGLGQYTLGVGTRLAVRRWAGDAPQIVP
ncbi:MAG: hypothetical protein AAFY38_17115 [Pseudomonadota bacterium]